MMMDASFLQEYSDREFISWQNFRLRHVSPKLSFLLINARSLPSKFNEIEARVARLKEKVTFIVITETHLDSNRDVCFELQGYNSKSFYRESDNHGGGIKVYYLNSVAVEILSDLHSPCCESIALKTDHNMCINVSSYVLSPNVSDHYVVAALFPLETWLVNLFK